jgi:hypothetical protein
VDAIEVESLVGDWGFELGAEKVYFRLSPGDLKSLGALGALWELFGSSSQLRIFFGGRIFKERNHIFHVSSVFGPFLA